MWRGDIWGGGHIHMTSAPTPLSIGASQSKGSRKESSKGYSSTRFLLFFASLCFSHAVSHSQHIFSDHDVVSFIMCLEKSPYPLESVDQECTHSCLSLGLKIFVGRKEFQSSMVLFRSMQLTKNLYTLSCRIK